MEPSPDTRAWRFCGMTERMLKFTTVERTTPKKRAADARAGDFHEIYADFIDAKAAAIILQQYFDDHVQSNF